MMSMPQCTQVRAEPAKNIAFNLQYQLLVAKGAFLDSTRPDQYGPRGF
jgi:hypothetical protein